MKKTDVYFQENVLVLHRTDESENNPKEFINKLHAALQTHMEQHTKLLVCPHSNSVEVWVEAPPGWWGRYYKTYCKLLLKPLIHHTSIPILQISFEGHAYVMQWPKDYIPKQKDLMCQGNRIVSYEEMQNHTRDARLVIPTNRYKQIPEIAGDFQPVKNKLRYKFYFELIHRFQQTYLPEGTRLGPAKVGTWRQPAEEELYSIPTDYALLCFHDGEKTLNARHGILTHQAYQFSPRKDIELHLLLPMGKTGMYHRISELFSDALDGMGWVMHFSGMRFHHNAAHDICYTLPEELTEKLRQQTASMRPDETLQHYYILVPHCRKDEYLLQEKERYKPVLLLLMNRHPVSLLYKGQLRKNHWCNTQMSLVLQVITQTGGQPWSISQPAMPPTDVLMAICSHRIDNGKRSSLSVGYDLTPEGIFDHFKLLDQLRPEALAAHIRETLVAYHRRTGQQPLRFIIHTFCHIDDESLQSIHQTLVAKGLRIPLILVEMRKGALGHRLLFRTDHPDCPIPLSGTCLRTGQEDYLLFNNEFFNHDREAGRRKQIYPLSCTIRQYANGCEQTLTPAELQQQLQLIYQMSRLCTFSPDMQHRPNSCVYTDNLAQRGQETVKEESGCQSTKYPLTSGE